MAKVNFKIDFVVTWVDGSDPQWQAKKQQYANLTGIFPGIALYIIAAMVMPEPGQIAPKAEKHTTDYQTGRPNTMNGDFTKSDDSSSDSDEKKDDNQE